MGVLQRFENRLEDVVGGAFARVFKGRVEPVEIAKALQREADSHRVILGEGRVMVPNRYVVVLGQADYERLSPWDAQLTSTLAEMLQEVIDDERWMAYGDIEVRFVLDQSLRTGVFRIGSDIEQNVPPRRRPHDSLSMPRVDYGPSAPRSVPPVPQRNVPAPAYAGPTTHQAHPGQRQQPQQPRRPSPPPRRNRPVLLVDETGQRFPLQQGTALLGRGTDAVVQLADSGVSRRHAVIRYDGTTSMIEDLGSTNGTIVNGQRVQRWQLLHGDVIRLGHSVVVYHEEPPS